MEVYQGKFKDIFLEYCRYAFHRSSGTSGSAPDLTSEYRPGPGGGTSPVTEVWTNPAHEMEDGGGLVTRSMTPSRSSGSITPSRRPHHLPDNINRELERKIGNGHHQASKASKNGKSSAESDGSPDESYNLNNRKKPGTLNDNFTRQRFPYFPPLHYNN